MIHQLRCTIMCHKIYISEGCVNFAEGSPFASFRLQPLAELRAREVFFKISKFLMGRVQAEVRKVFAEYLNEFSLYLNNNYTIVITLKMRIEWCKKSIRKVDKYSQN